jgi:hypothetical protein
MSDDQETNECLPLDDVALIRPLLDEFKSSKRGERKHVVRKGLTAVVAAREISHLRPLAQGKIIAQIKEVRPASRGLVIYLIIYRAETFNSK